LGSYEPEVSGTEWVDWGEDPVAVEVLDVAVRDRLNPAKSPGADVDFFSVDDCVFVGTIFDDDDDVDATVVVWAASWNVVALKGEGVDVAFATARLSSGQGSDQVFAGQVSGGAHSATPV
jgi:hypothetical protein